MQATTIKLHLPTKKALDTLRTESESYEQIIERLIHTVRHKDLKKELIEGYHAMAERDRILAREWDVVSAEIEE